MTSVEDACIVGILPNGDVIVASFNRSNCRVIEDTWNVERGDVSPNKISAPLVRKATDD